MSNTIEFRHPSAGSRPALQSIAGTASRRGQTPLAPLAVKLAAPAGAITVGTMRAVVAASDALRRHLTDPAVAPPTLADLRRPRGALAELLHRYQTASRQCVREWLQDPRSTVWLVEAGSGRILDTTAEPVPDGGGLNDRLQATLADVQPLHGLRERHLRPGVGVPVVVSHREPNSQQRARRLTALAVLTRTAIVGVERGFDARVRSVRVRLLDPDSVEVMRVHGAELPLAADWTAAVAFQLGRERRPMVAATHETHDGRGSGNGFTPLTPLGSTRSPLVLVEGNGLSPLMMAHVANEIAGDAELRARYGVWLYRYPMTAPLVQSASRLRADLERFCARLDVPGLQARATVVAQGPSAVLARALFIDSGEALWDAVFATPPELTALGARDRRMLESLLRWRRSARVARIVAVNLPDNLPAMAAGVGERAVQATQQQSKQRRAMLERVLGTTRRSLRPAPIGPTRFAEPLHEAVYAGALAADRALLGLLDDTPSTLGAVLYDVAAGSAPADTLAVRDGAPLGPQALRQLLAWLRRPSRNPGA
jgi:hypothetical protein